MPIQTCTKLNEFGGFFYFPSEYGNTAICRCFSEFIFGAEIPTLSVKATIRLKNPKEKGFKRCFFNNSGSFGANVGYTTKSFPVCPSEHAFLASLGIGKADGQQKHFWIKIQPIL